MLHQLTIRSQPTVSSNKIKGYAAVWNQPALVKQKGMQFTESIKRGALTYSDVRLFWNHNDDIILGRQASGTVIIGEDDYGLWFEAELPVSRSEYLESIERKDVDGCSVGIRDTKWANNNGIAEIVGGELIEISICPMPVYSNTTVEVVRKMELNKRKLRLRQIDMF